ncbi:MAG: hypothetical protein HRU32_13215 [Rhodobacteraceae bacterium]|nr:hypothetical protein [Paracoccaceae bacterium]
MKIEKPDAFIAFDAEGRDAQPSPYDATPSRELIECYSMIGTVAIAAVDLTDPDSPATRSVMAKVLMLARALGQSEMVVTDLQYLAGINDGRSVLRQLKLALGHVYRDVTGGDAGFHVAEHEGASDLHVILN